MTLLLKCRAAVDRLEQETLEAAESLPLALDSQSAAPQPSTATGNDAKAVALSDSQSEGSVVTAEESRAGRNADKPACVPCSDSVEDCRSSDDEDVVEVVPAAVEMVVAAGAGANRPRRRASGDTSTPATAAPATRAGGRQQKTSVRGPQKATKRTAMQCVREGDVAEVKKGKRACTAIGGNGGGRLCMGTDMAACTASGGDTKRGCGEAGADRGSSKCTPHCTVGTGRYGVEESRKGNGDGLSNIVRHVDGRHSSSVSGQHLAVSLHDSSISREEEADAAAGAGASDRRASPVEVKVSIAGA